MTGALVPSALLRRDETSATALLDALGDEVLDVPGPWLTLLEEHLPSRPASASSEEDITRRLERARDAVMAGGLVLVSAQGLRVVPDVGHGTDEVITLTRVSATTRGVLADLLGVPAPPLGEPARRAAIATLVEHGLLVPPVGALDWGDLRRRTPLCPAFGSGRGTPIDRWYLDRFVEDVRNTITGEVLAIGGARSDRLHFGLRSASAFRILDVVERTGVDIVGDVHDRSLVDAASLDSTLLFNVLEHCLDPRAVVANVRHWLRPGGRCFVMVPNAQRLHAAPVDLWRFSAAGLAELFQGWAAVDVRSYGNLTTVLASHLGIAAEELSPHELELVQADHPVATCAVATA